MARPKGVGIVIAPHWRIVLTLARTRARRSALSSTTAPGSGTARMKRRTPVFMPWPRSPGAPDHGERLRLPGACLGAVLGSGSGILAIGAARRSMSWSDPLVCSWSSATRGARQSTTTGVPGGPLRERAHILRDVVVRERRSRVDWPQLLARDPGWKRMGKADGNFAVDIEKVG